MTVSTMALVAVTLAVSRGTLLLTEEVCGHASHKRRETEPTNALPKQWRLLLLFFFFTFLSIDVRHGD